MSPSEVWSSCCGYHGSQPDSHGLVAHGGGDCHRFPLCLCGSRRLAKGKVVVGLSALMATASVFPSGSLVLRFNRLMWVTRGVGLAIMRKTPSCFRANLRLLVDSGSMCRIKSVSCPIRGIHGSGIWRSNCSRLLCRSWSLACWANSALCRISSVSIW